MLIGCLIWIRRLAGRRCAISRTLLRRRLPRRARVFRTRGLARGFSPARGRTGRGIGPAESLARLLLSDQVEDGGWNCEAPKSTRSSFHSTICVLEGLLEYERAIGGSLEITAARRRGEEYLLERGLFRRRSTGQVANAEFLKFAFPPRYHYDVLRALDYFREAGAQPDARFSDAVHIVESRRQADGRWVLEGAYDEALAIPFSESVGEPSGWITLRALRVLRWWERR